MKVVTGRTSIKLQHVFRLGIGRQLCLEFNPGLFMIKFILEFILLGISRNRQKA